jgi:hypothetical protein
MVGGYWVKGLMINKTDCKDHATLGQQYIGVAGGYKLPVSDSGDNSIKSSQ